MKRFFNIKIIFLSLLVLLTLIVSVFGFSLDANAMPYYDLKPQKQVQRAQFSTDYSKSTEERKHNIELAAKSLNNVFIDVDGEFSFNSVVGARTVKRGYKSAKIIVNGEFVEGVGGGVCQVSTTLYNAAICAGLTITEVHAHSLAVSYVKPSCDAMVNSGSADLRFINKTHNPIVIKSTADGNTITFKIYGEPMTVKYRLKSVIKEEILPKYTVITDTAGDYPDLYVGERRMVNHGKKGYKSEGYLVKTINGEIVSSVKIRQDKYPAIGGVIVEGRATNAEENAL